MMMAAREDRRKRRYGESDLSLLFAAPIFGHPCGYDKTAGNVMFHRFSVAPARARNPPNTALNVSIIDGQRAFKDSPSKSNLVHRDHPTTRRRLQNLRACERCRQHRVKCDEFTPCRHCIRANCPHSCIRPGISQGKPYGMQQSRQSTSQTISEQWLGSFPIPATSSSSTDDTVVNGGRNSKGIGSSNPTVSLPDNQVLYSGMMPEFLHPFASSNWYFPQFPNTPVPTKSSRSIPLTPHDNQRSQYLRLFWDICHPLLLLMSETEFAELETWRQPNSSAEYSVRDALIDSMIALGMQQSSTTGLSRRILGLQKYHPLQDAQGDAPPADAWLGFEHFHRSRERMRTNEDVSLEALRCHALMILYLMKGNAFRDAYNLLGITVRKAYVAKIHRQPPSYLASAERTAHMQLWWTLFCLDVQCSSQLDMPAASQVNLVKCKCPDEAALASYINSRPSTESDLEAVTFSVKLIELALVSSDISATVPVVDFAESEANDPEAFVQHASDLFLALQQLEAWRAQLPPRFWPREKLDNATPSTFDFDPTLPAGRQRQIVLLELHYRNVYILTQRPLIQLRRTHPRDDSSVAGTVENRQPHVRWHVDSALHHSAAIVDLIVAVCSNSDVLYGWSEALQPLWNAAMTITAFIYANVHDFAVPQALEDLQRAQTVFDSFSATYPAASTAKGIIESLVSDVMIKIEQGHSSNLNRDAMAPSIFQSTLPC